MVAAIPQSRFQADPAARTRRENRTFTTGTQSSATQTRTITYNHTQGVRISRDPIAEKGGLNLYGYVGNNPIRYIDPMGLDTISYHDTGSEMDQAANIRPTFSTAITVSSHGNGVNLTRDDGIPLLLQDVAERIKNLKDYNPNTPIRLFACWGGQGDASAAQRLSNYLPNKIIASTTQTKETHFMDSTGKKVTGSSFPEPIDGGRWREFQGGKALN